MELTCPKCLSNEVIRLDLTDGDTLTCSGCDEEYSLADVEAVVASWSKMLPWLRCHPARQLDQQPAGAAP